MVAMNGLRSRRHLLKLMGVGGVGIAASCASSLFGNAQSAQAAGATADKPVGSSLKRLMEGNSRFMEEKFQNPNRSLSRLKEVAQKQQPFAAVLSCADSRVPAEIIFDQGIGDIFDVRIAGNIATPEAIASLEYAAVKLDVPLIMVLGHERCGAVKAALAGGELPGQISTLVKAIEPAIKNNSYLSDLNSSALVNQAVEENIRYQIEKLQKESKVLADLVQKGKLKIRGGWYDLDTGEVCLVRDRMLPSCIHY
ncbi:carbonic anhydrase [Nostoc sp. NIES-4103]|nr:carbonic anhydrase [Nostoc sp. NIES-4103]